MSSSRRLFSQSELLELLRSSRERNQRVDITGLLLYHEGNLLQVLEGPPADLLATFERIMVDPRHTGLIVLSKKTIEERQFAGWSMAFRNLDEDQAEELPGFSHFLQSPSVRLPVKEEGTADKSVRILVSRFRQSLR